MSSTFGPSPASLLAAIATLERDPCTCAYLGVFDGIRVYRRCQRCEHLGLLRAELLETEAA